MKFRVVEQKSKNLEELYPLFKKEFLNPHTHVKDVKETLQLTNSEYKHLRNRIIDETGLDVKPNPYNPTGYYDYPNKYIHKSKNCYVIKKDRTYYGRFSSLKDAQLVRDELIKNNWNKKIL